MLSVSQQRKICEGGRAETHPLLYYNPANGRPFSSTLVTCCTSQQEKQWVPACQQLTPRMFFCHQGRPDPVLRTEADNVYKAVKHYPKDVVFVDILIKYFTHDPSRISRFFVTAL